MSKVSLKKSKTKGTSDEVVLVRELMKEGKTGVLATGTYEGFKANKFNPAKNDYFVRGTDGTLYIINETTSLKEQFAALDGIPNVQVEVLYNGKKQTKSGRGFHDFEVFADISVDSLIA